MSKTINIFGDSIAWGAFDDQGGWADRLKNYLMMKGRVDYSEVYNLGISSENSDKLLKRFASENEARNPDVIMIAVGVNDSQYVKSKNNPRVSLEKLEQNLLEMIKQARGREIIFVGITSVDESKVRPIPWSPVKYYDNGNITIYNAKIKEICGKSGLLFIEMQDLLKDEDLEDGLHPNSKGHEKMFLRVKDFLESNKIT